MFFGLFHVIPLEFTTWNLSEKRVIEKMAYLVELWLILESELVEHAPHGIFIYGSENCTHNTKECTLTNTFGLMEFGYVMNKL
jgi:hypothetical protein